MSFISQIKKSLTNFLNYKFAVQHINPIYIKKQETIKQKYTKEYLQKLSEDPNYIFDEKKQKELLEKKRIEEQIKNNVSNDNEKGNHLLKVKIRNEDKLKKFQDAIKREDEVQIFRVQPREVLPSAIAIRRSCRSSLKKLHFPSRLILQKHVFDAMMYLQQQETKGSDYVKRCLISAIQNAKNKELDLDRMYVKDCIIGKQRRMKSIRYHAKMRHGQETSDICQIRIKIEQKPISYLFEKMMQGKTPNMLSYMMREQIKKDGADYKTITNQQGMLHAKGRQQLKLMLKRRVMSQYLLFRSKGMEVNQRVIQKRLLAQEGRLYEEKYYKEKLERKMVNIKARQKIFEINQAATQ